MRGHDNPYLEICFRPTVATINDARRLVATLYGPLLADPDIAARLALATHEMLENALKYSLDGATVIRVELSHSHGPRSIKVETRNLLSPDRRAGLDEVFAEMARFGDANEFYQFAMKRTRTLRHGSGLGLARIWAEADMQLSHTFEGDEARVTAVLSVEEKKMMSPLSLPMVSPPGFAIVPEEGEGTITLRFRGIGDLSSIEPLDDYLRAVHEEARKNKAESVVVDFRALEFMNSSCFKCFVEWLGTVQDLPPAERYGVVFESNREMHWQRRSLNALRCFAMDVVTVSAA